MSKKNKQPVPEQVPVQPAPPPKPEEPAEAPVSKAQIWTFWSAVAVALITARYLNYALPHVSESVIERWIMGGFALFLIGFLVKLGK